MGVIFTDQRRLLPRWRRFQNPANHKELNSTNKKSLTKSENIDHHNAIEFWVEKNDLVNAIELCSSAIVHGIFKDANAAASYIIENKPHSKSVIQLAQKVLHPDRMIAESVVDDRYVEIAILKKRSRQSPHNAILWTDMALAYSSLGQNDKAKRAVEIALILAPHNRFVVRCATRFFVHIHENSRAYKIVKNYRFLRNDPWVLAIELSLSSIRENPSRHAKLANNMINKRSTISPFHISELASALGEIESQSGAYKKALKLLEHSLIKPTDNSIAQAQWMKNKHKLKISIDDDVINKDLVHEAQSYKHFHYGNWKQNMEEAQKWAKYEPYSTRPFEHMSYVSCVCQDNYTDCIKYSENGLKLDKKNFTLLNNLVIGYALKGDITNAKKTFDFIKPFSLAADNRPVYTATKGMLAFKQKNIDEGMYLYNSAIDTMKHAKQRGQHMAGLFLAREQILAKTPDAHTFFNDLKKKLKETDPDIIALKKHVEKLIA